MEITVIIAGSVGVCSKEWAVGRLHEKAGTDSTYNFLLRQSEKEFNCYTLVYMKPSHSVVCLQIRRSPDSGQYHLTVDDSTVTFSSVSKLINYYKSSSSDKIVLQRCVAPSNPRMSTSVLYVLGDHYLT